MKAIVLHEYGDAGKLQWQEVPAPAITQENSVLVKVKATAVNPLDYQVRRGDYKSLFQLPLITGHDVAGDVVAVGSAVKNWQPGDAVYYSPPFGGQGSYAEYHVTDASTLSAMPRNLTYEEAAALPLIGGTV